MDLSTITYYTSHSHKTFRLKNGCWAMDRVEEILSKLVERYGDSYFRDDPYRVLITTILSQRTRDENTRKASQQLFKKFPTPESLANAELDEIEQIIKIVGFPKQKAERIREVARKVCEMGGVPSQLDELLNLPGVGRKTANCVLVYGFGQNAVPVDTHVHRISNRLGIVSTSTPEQTEREIMERVPKEFWVLYNIVFVRFGQDICRPLNPRCDVCPVSELCPSKEE